MRLAAGKLTSPRRGCHSPSLGLARLGNKYWNPSDSALLVFRVMRKCCNGKLPKPRSLRLVLCLAHSHPLHDGLIANLNIWIDAQIVHPSRISRRSALRPDEHIAAPVFNAHEGRLTDCTGLVADVGHDDDGQPCIEQGGAFGTTTPFVNLNLLTHPVFGARHILCHGILHRSFLLPPHAIQLEIPPYWYGY